MASELLMPRQGNTAESCVILEWKKKVGDPVSPDDVVCEVETDKATFEVEAGESGTLLKLFFEEGDDVPVLAPIAAIGEKGEDISGLGPSAAGSAPDEGAKDKPIVAAEPTSSSAVEPSAAQVGAPVTAPVAESGFIAVSPRARRLAEKKGIDYRQVAGTGPGGRIIERDIEYVLSARAPFSPAAVEASLQQESSAPSAGSGIGGRVLTADLGSGTAFEAAPVVSAAAFPGPVRDIPVKGVRKVIAQRMHASLSQTAQLTMNASADARVLLAYRKKLKSAPEESGLSLITINDLVVFAVSRVLPRYPFLNAHFLGDTIREFANVHLGVAIDTERGLMVPVVKNANALSLQQLAGETKRLASACQGGSVLPDELSGGTFTVTNLGVLGIESFTPVLNAPETGILGVCTIQPKPVLQDGETVFNPHIGFSLTINHQAVDGAPAGRFLKELTEAVAGFDLLLAI